MLLNDAKKTATLILGTLGDRASSMRDESQANLAARDGGPDVRSAEEIAAQQVIDAIHAKNAGAFVKAFRAMWALCEATEYED